jgi:pSer/pThr/pTyr-binding forkhead associated (FHA) protein
MNISMGYAWPVEVTRNKQAHPFFNFNQKDLRYHCRLRAVNIHISITVIKDLKCGISGTLFNHAKVKSNFNTIEIPTKIGCNS